MFSTAFMMCKFILWENEIFKSGIITKEEEETQKYPMIRKILLFEIECE